MLEALDIWVKGVVQGVGFRPFVYRLAKRHLINGWVLNGADGVHIHAEGEEKLLDEFVLAISEDAPAAAQVTEIEMREVPLEDFESFEIRTSDDSGDEERTLVSPDLATCADCERELFDPSDRRYRYPFINCTNCGPRFTIIDSLPYDRASTSMRGFPMCDECAAEYADPSDRRFHAQPDACFACGPSLSFAYRQTKEADAADVPSTLSCASKSGSRTEVRFAGLSPQPDALGTSSLTDSDLHGLKIIHAQTREETDAVFAAAVEMLLAGKILAVKGLGGFHLVCDANNAEAVAELRRRKHRPGKAFAVMCERLDDVRAICQVEDAERRLLEGSQRPIVLCRKLPGVPTPPGVADGLPEIGVMLPYTPVQHILLHDFAAACGTPSPRCKPSSRSEVRHVGLSRESDALRTAGGCSTPSPYPSAAVPMLVMTSGNLHDEPIVISDEEAYEKLAGIADAFLGNNRPIVARFDDSVVRAIAAPDGQAIQFIRRARGYAPLPLPVKPSEASCLFVAGPEQKNTFAFMRGDEAFVSQHIGDVEDADTFDAWRYAKARYEELFDLAPEALACDLHPEYITSKWAHAEAAERGLPLTEVQHHHAHIVSVMAEHGLTDAVCGIAFDGTGYGTDGAIWGGEVLLSNRSAFERFANFAYVPMPGGRACVEHPLRMAYGVLWEYDLLDHAGAERALAELGAEQAEVCRHMIETGLNTPYTSSVGRLFDAASALLGVCTQPTYEGEPAIMLEAALDDEGLSAFEGAGVGAHANALSGEVDGEGGRDRSRSDEDGNEAGPVDGDASERYAVAVVKNTATAESTAQDTSVALFDAEPTFRALLDDLAAGVPVPVIARRFHDAIGGAIIMAAQLVAAAYDIRTVALSGGVFMNRYLVQRVLAQLQDAGFTAAINRDLPPNDGCISLGQAVVGSSAS